MLPERDDVLLHGKATTLASLLPITADLVVVGGGELLDLGLDALAERRTLDWFDRHALAMEAIVYVTAGAPDTAVAQRIAVHPGLIVEAGGWRPEEVEPDALLASALDASRPGLLARVARRLPPDVRGARPTSADLAHLAVVVAPTPGRRVLSRRPCCAPGV